MATNKKQIILFVTVLVIVILNLLLWMRSSPNFNMTLDSMVHSSQGQKNDTDRDTNVPNTIFRPLPSGFDETGLSLFENRTLAITKDIFENGLDAIYDINIIPFGTFKVWRSTDWISKWWQQLNSFPIKWEPETYQIFFRFINSQTIIIDFGTWIGPTILYEAQFGSQVYGIESDPFALAEVLKNIELNSDKSWYKNIHIQPGCIATPEDEGIITMKSEAAGNSCSGIGEKVGCGDIKITWNVQCYQLPKLLKHWNILRYWEKGKNMFIKIDIESYECKLVPSFYNWLSNIPISYLPTFYISYHPPIQECTDEQLRGFASIIELYEEVIVGNANLFNVKRLKIQKVQNRSEIYDFVKICMQDKANQFYQFVLHVNQ